MVLLAATLILGLMIATSLVGVLAGLRPHRSKGAAGERMAAKRLLDLNPEIFRTFHDLYLPRPEGDGTITQIDHLVISRFGIFVIETKNYDGWIFGGARQKLWTQSIFGRNTQFQNPLHQNYLHVQATKAFLSLAERQFHSLVFFVDGDFRSEMPENVICSDLCGWIAGHRATLLNDETIRESIRRLEELERQTDRKAAKAKLLQQLKRGNRQGPRVTGERDLPGEIAATQPPPLPPSPWNTGRPEPGAVPPNGQFAHADARQFIAGVRSA
ncbi:nuclease-related domain-containing protein [Haloferula sp. BvORR071]|uniref:nuclease-related domain-containing protein n=1 Tax=Haloferula sp. BvORR071 TaxID=1396141 RepID=UPI000698F41E|nr:nuclease-related domain-containing protein [Haloferula sp. BvORR071]